MFGSADTGAVEVDDALAETVAETAADAPGDVVRVRPFKESPGLDDGEAFMRGLHRTDRDGGLPTYAFEWWFDERRLKPVVYTPDPDGVVDLVNSRYPNSSVQVSGDRFPAVEQGDHVAVARLALSDDAIFPTAIPDGDPYKTLLPKLVGRGADERVLMQVVFRPTTDRWFRRGKMGADGDVIAENVKKGRLVGEVNPKVVQSDSDTKKARDIQEQRGKPAFTVTVRVAAIAPDPQTAVERRDDVTGAFGEYDHDYADQGFEATPLSGSDARAALENAARRKHRQKGRVARWLRGPSNVLTAEQLGAVAYLPNAEVNVPDVDWSRMESGPGVPPDAPQFADGDVAEKAAHSSDDAAGGGRS